VNFIKQNIAHEGKSSMKKINSMHYSAGVKSRNVEGSRYWIILAKAA
jgi:hypothetical protein